MISVPVFHYEQNFNVFYSVEFVPLPLPHLSNLCQGNAIRFKIYCTVLFSGTGTASTKALKVNLTTSFLVTGCRFTVEPMLIIMVN